MPGFLFEELWRHNWLRNFSEEESTEESSSEESTEVSSSEEEEVSSSEASSSSEEEAKKKKSKKSKKEKKSKKSEKSKVVMTRVIDERELGWAVWIFSFKFLSIFFLEVFFRKFLKFQISKIPTALTLATAKLFWAWIGAV